jgi:WD40 repeat protein
MIPCPPLDELGQVLDRDDESPRGRLIKAHLETCEKCQERVKRLESGISLGRRGEPSGDGGSALGQSDRAFLERIIALGRPGLWADLSSGPDAASSLPPDGASEDLQSTTEPCPDPGPQPLPSISGLTIIREIGRGGMGIVYEAIDPSLGRRVAVKLMPPQWTSHPTAVERFRREARSPGRLHHPNIVPIHGVGRDEQQFYYTMPLIDGEAMDRIWTRLHSAKSAKRAGPGSVPPSRVGEGPGAMPSTEAPDLHFRPEGSNSNHYREMARLSHQAADGLSFAHDHGILHRDIKPSNLLIDRRGHLWITDFGLARAFEGEDALTETGDVVGTLRYMAPERFDGVSDARCDVYSLGVTLYEMITLEKLFPVSDRIKLVERVLNDEPRLPWQVDPRIPIDLSTIALKAIDKDPNARYQTARELADDLDRFIAGKPIRGRTIGVLGRTGRWCLRKPLLAGSLAMAAVAVVAALAIAARSALREAEHVRVRQELAGQVDSASERLADSRSGSALRQAILEFERAEALLKEEQLAPALHHLVASWRAARDAGDSGWQHTARASLSFWSKRLPRLKAVFSGFSPRGAAFSEDGRLLLTGTTRGAELYNFETAEPLGARFGQSNGPCALSPDGKTVLASEAGGARLWSVSDGRPRGGLMPLPKSLSGAQFSPDGQTVLALSDLDSEAWLWDVATSRRIHGPIRSDYDRTIRSACFSPDSRLLLIGLLDGTARFWRTAGGPPGFWPLQHEKLKPGSPPEPGLQLPKLPVTLVGFGPDSKTVLTGGRDGTLRLWRTTMAASPVGSPMHHGGEVTAHVFSADGTRLVTAASDNMIRFWNVSPSTGKPSGEPIRSPSRISRLAFSRDGKMLRAVGDRGVLTWDATTRQPVGDWPSLPESPLVIGSFERLLTSSPFSPDEKAILTSGGDSSIHLWDLTPPRHEFLLPHDRGINDAVYSADGSTILTNNIKARLWDTRSGSCRSGPTPDRVSVYSIALSPDGKLMATGQINITQLWDAATMAPVGPLLQHPIGSNGLRAIYQVAFADRGRVLMTRAGDSVQLWDTASFRPIGPPLGHPRTIICCSLSPDGNSLLTCGGFGAWVWPDAIPRRKAGESVEPRQLSPEHCISAIYSGDGKTIITGLELRMFDAETGLRIGQVLQEPFLFSNAVACRDRRLIALVNSRGYNRAIRLWDLDTGRPFGPTFAHPEEILSLAISSDGATILTGCRDGAARLWDTATGRVIAMPKGPAASATGTPRGPADQIRVVRLSPDGTQAFAGGDDGRAWLWDITELPDDLPRVAAWVQVSTGMVLDDHGHLRSLDNVEWRQRRQELARLGGAPWQKPNEIPVRMWRPFPHRPSLSVTPTRPPESPPAHGG